MKFAAVYFILIIAGISAAKAQSHSFETLKKKFSGNENVHSFNAAGFLARSVLWLSGEKEFTRAIQEIKHIRLITIPISAFEEKGLSVRGFTKILRRDAFEELALFRNESDLLTVYLQTNQDHDENRYFLLIENPHEVVAVEIKGYIDPNLLHTKKENLTYTN